MVKISQSKQPPTAPAAPDWASVDARLEAHLPQLLEDIGTLVAIPSVAGSPAPGAPYGQAVDQALAAALQIAQRLGFATENVDGHLGLADLAGHGQGQVGVLGHLDVVPADAAEWRTPPFAAVEKDGMLYGRGVVDDKGPLLAALHAAAVLQEAGLSLNKSVRFLMGCNEENGMSCVKYYLTKYEQPEYGFTPDGHFPAIIGEKGIYHYQLCRSFAAPEPPLPGLPQLLSLSAGQAENVIPGTAKAVFAAGEGLAAALSGREGLQIQQEGAHTVLIASGQAAHASTPEDGVNAITRLLDVLAELNFGPLPVRAFINDIQRLITVDDRHGAGFGLDEADALSANTHAPTMLQLDHSGARLTLDLRFLLSRKAKHYRKQLRSLAQQQQMVFVERNYHNPLYLGENHPLTEMLLQSYREVSGDNGPAEVIGGGSYAKTLKNFLAFGAEPAGAAEMAHQANEAISCLHLLDCLKIYARAIYRMAMAD